MSDISLKASAPAVDLVESAKRRIDGASEPFQADTYLAAAKTLLAYARALEAREAELLLNWKEAEGQRRVAERNEGELRGRVALENAAYAAAHQDRMRGAAALSAVEADRDELRHVVETCCGKWRAENAKIHGILQAAKASLSVISGMASGFYDQEWCEEADKALALITGLEEAA